MAETGSETALVVEDDRAVRLLLKRMLERLGYEASAAADAAEALPLCCQRDFDLVVSDLALPGLSGADLAEIVHEADPNAAVVFITGYCTSSLECGPNGQHVKLPPSASGPILAKPFSSAELAETIADLRDEDEAASALAPQALVRSGWPACSDAGGARAGRSRAARA